MSTKKINSTKLNEVIVEKTMNSIAEGTNKVETAATAPAPKAKKTSTPKAEKKSTVTKAIQDAQKNALVEEVISKREVKYIYPKDVTTGDDKKKFRQQVRNKLKKLELELRRIEDTTSKEYLKKEKEYKAYRKTVLKEGATIAA